MGARFDCHGSKRLWPLLYLAQSALHPDAVCEDKILFLDRLTEVLGVHEYLCPHDFLHVDTIVVFVKFTFMAKIGRARLDKTPLDPF